MSLSAALHSIITSQNVCFLCYKSIDEDAVVSAHDEIYVKLLRCAEKKTLTDILRCVLGTALNEIPDFTSCFTKLCIKCTQTLVNSYTFIQNSVENIKDLNKSLSSLSDVVQYTANEDDCRSLYISFNLKDSMTKIYYANEEPASTAKEALHQFEELDNVQPEYRPKRRYRSKKDRIGRFLNNHQVQCVECNKVYANYKTLIAHYNAVHSKKKEKKTIKEGQCRVCTRENPVFNFPRKKGKKRKCDQCILDRAGIGNYLGDGILGCKLCEKQFTQYHSLRAHVSKYHTEKKVVIKKCDQCDRVFNNEDLLEQHVYNSHQEAICSQCGEKFENRHSLKRHDFFHHNRYHTIVCPDCGRCYKNASSYKVHKAHKVCEQKFRTKRTDGQYTCDYCKKKYVHKVTLKNHITLIHLNGECVVCEWCNKRCYSKSHLMAHIVTHTKEKKFKCELCRNYFVSKEALLYHTRIHTGEKPYDCTICQEKFLNSSRRASHLKRAHKSSEYKCNECSSTFGTVYYLKKHITAFHTGQDEPEVPNEVQCEVIVEEGSI